MQDQFIAAVDAEHHSDYEAFLKAKVEFARAQIAEGRHLSNDDTQAAFSERRDAVRRRIGEKRKGES